MKDWHWKTIIEPHRIKAVEPMSVCYSRVATPEHVLETLRSLRRGGKITFSDIAIKALTHGRSAFGLWIKIVAAAQRFGLLTLAEKTGLLRAAGLQWFAPVARMAETPPPRP